MASITSSPITEDRYIAHLAGMQTGKKIIGFYDKYKAYSAQKHPISNKIAASMIGSIKGGVITTFGVLAYPLVNNSMRSSILGSGWSVCTACGVHAKSVADVILSIEQFVEPEKAQSYWEKKANSYVMGFKTIHSCATDDQSLMSCRAVNYVGGVWDTLSNNYMLIGAVTVGLVALFTYSKLHTYAKQESLAEKDIKKDLIDRFGKIATRLKALEASKEVQECARNILQRQLEINKELESLQLPTLTWKDIEQITQPVFDAAKSVKQKGKHKLA